jgi:GNAT superfamily N-acetyltransferase
MMIKQRNNAIVKLSALLGKSRVFRLSKLYAFRKDYVHAQSKLETNGKLDIRPVGKKDIPKFHNISKKGRANFEENFNRGIGGMAAIFGDDLVHWSLYALKSGYQEMVESKIVLNPGSALIFSVYTNPKYRGKNIAGQVLDTLCRNLYSKGIKRFYVFVHMYNYSGINMFSKVGFHKIGSVTFIKLLNFSFFRMKGNEEHGISDIRRSFRTRLLRCKTKAITLS